MIRAIKAIEEADICILMLDATVGLESQDLSILGLIQKRKKGIVIVVNKWDLVPKETNTARDFEKDLRKKWHHLLMCLCCLLLYLKNKEYLKLLNWLWKLIRTDEPKLRHPNSMT